MAEKKEKVEEVSIESTEDKETTTIDEGSFVNLHANTGYREFGCILKYVSRQELLEYDPELPKSVGNFDVIGTYHLGEVSHLVNTNSQERPTLYLMVARVLNEHECTLLAHDENIDDDLKQRIYDDLKAIASKDEAIGDRINELMRMSVMACMTKSMSSSTQSNIDEMKEFMTDEERKQFEAKEVLSDEG